MASNLKPISERMEWIETEWTMKSEWNGINQAKKEVWFDWSIKLIKADWMNAECNEANQLLIN